MHPIFNRFKEQVPQKAVSTHFGLMTDLSRFSPVPLEHPHARYPGVLMGSEYGINDSKWEHLGVLLSGSTATPTAAHALGSGRHVFIQLLNPLDSSLRQAMNQHRDAEQFPVLILGKDSVCAPATPPVRYWDVALTDTEGRAEVDPEEWLASAEQLVEALPAALSTQGRFASAKWYHVYFVVPDDERHPLYKRVT